MLQIFTQKVTLTLVYFFTFFWPRNIILPIKSLHASVIKNLKIKFPYNHSSERIINLSGLMEKSYFIKKFNAFHQTSPI